MDLAKGWASVMWAAIGTVKLNMHDLA